MKWKDISTSQGKKTFRPDEDDLIENVETKKDYKELVKKYHPDTSDSFFKKRNTKILQKLNQIKNKKDG